MNSNNQSFAFYVVRGTIQFIILCYSLAICINENVQNCTYITDYSMFADFTVFLI